MHHLPKTSLSQRAPKKRRKHHNRPVYVTPDGQFVGEDHPGKKRKCFDSETEFRRFLTLRAEQAAGFISRLQTQKTYHLHAAGGQRVARYRADFVYVRNGRLIVEDVKSAHTVKLAHWKRVKKWMKAEYGIEVTEYIEPRTKKRKG